jgi:hypothetical protein
VKLDTAALAAMPPAHRDLDFVRRALKDSPQVEGRSTAEHRARPARQQRCLLGGELREG